MGTRETVSQAEGLASAKENTAGMFKKRQEFPGRRVEGLAWGQAGDAMTGVGFEKLGSTVEAPGRGQRRPRGSDKQIPGCTLLCEEEKLKGPQEEQRKPS